MTARKEPAPGAVWARAEDAVTRFVGDEAFVAVSGEGSIHTLNATASAVWRALEEPRTLAELCDLFEAAFPDVEPGRMADDLGALLESLERDGLVRRRP